MAVARKCEVLIAGAGPAGLATALFILKRRPDLAGRVIAIEKSAHPRFKVCAGGLIPKTMLALGELQIALEAPAIEVIRGAARTPVGDVDLTRDGEVLCTVIRRDQFDAQLARAAVRAGLEIVENTRVLEVVENDGEVSVATARGNFAARVLVGADGSGSIVRRIVFGRPAVGASGSREKKAADKKIIDKDKETLGRALMADIPVDAARTPEFVEGRYRFDFRCVEHGIKGYSWSFPCVIDGRPHLNVGIYDQCPREYRDRSERGEKSRRFATSGARPHGEQARMIAELAASFPELPIEGLNSREIGWHAFPIRWFSASDRYVRGHVMLAGDAAGVDPLMGEGISCAFEHGKLAAIAIDGLLAGNDAAIADYDRALHDGAVGKKLAKLAFAARHFYGGHYRWYFRLARVSRRAQEMGVDWYNGARHLDEVPTGSLIARWARAVLSGSAVR